MSRLTEDTSVRDLLVSYDKEISELIEIATDSNSASNRLYVLGQLRHSVAIHDSVIQSVLCPILEELPNGRHTSTPLLSDTQRRSALLEQLRQATLGPSPYALYDRNVAEIDRIVSNIRVNFQQHDTAESVDVGWLLEESSTNTDPDVLAARLALEARRIAGRTSPFSGRRTQTTIRGRMSEYLDDLLEGHSGYHGWSR